MAAEGNGGVCVDFWEVGIVGGCGSYPATHPPRHRLTNVEAIEGIFSRGYTVIYNRPYLL